MSFDKLDLTLWKYIQDRFAKDIGLGIYTIDRDGELIVSSGETSFLHQLIKSKRKDIFKERHYSQLKDLESDDVVLFKFYGAVSIMAPIVLHDRMIGAVVCGPVLSENFDYADLAARLNVGEDELEQAANEIKDATHEQVDMYRKLVSILSGILPKLSHQKLSNDKEINELKALQLIIKMVNSTLELDEIMQKIMDFLVKSLDATDCCIFVKTEDGEKKYCLKREVENLIKIEKVVSAKAIEEQQIITVKDIGARFGIEVVEEYNSMLSMPLKHRDKMIGSINIYGKELGGISEDDLNFLSTMTNQVAIAVVNAQRYEEVKELAVVDKMTGTFNKRHFIELLEKRMESEISMDKPLSLILLDIDNFGHYNNTHGHPQGDELLKDLSRVVKSVVRGQDLVGRYGGEEFIVMIPDLKSNEAMDTAKRIKNAIAEHKFEGEESQPGGSVTVSLGLASCMDNIATNDLVKEADYALYKAKDTGKNRVVQKIILKSNLRTEMSSET